MEKMTYVKALNIAIECGALPTEVVEKLTALRDAQEKRTHAVHKPTANQVANDGFKGDILAHMESGKGYTITELIQVVPTLSEVSNQRVSAIVRQMVADGLVTREEVKRKAYFTKVEG